MLLIPCRHLYNTHNVPWLYIICIQVLYNYTMTIWTACLPAYQTMVPCTWYVLQYCTIIISLWRYSGWMWDYPNQLQQLNLSPSMHAWILRHCVYLKMITNSPSSRSLCLIYVTYAYLIICASECSEKYFELHHITLQLAMYNTQVKPEPLHT